MLRVIATNPRGERIEGTCALAAVTLGPLYADLVREGRIQVVYEDSPKPWTYEIQTA